MEAKQVAKELRGAQGFESAGIKLKGRHLLEATFDKQAAPAAEE